MLRNALFLIAFHFAGFVVTFTIRILTTSGFNFGRKRNRLKVMNKAYKALITLIALLSCFYAL